MKLRSVQEDDTTTREKVDIAATAYRAAKAREDGLNTAYRAAADETTQARKALVEAISEHCGVPMRSDVFGDRFELDFT